MKRHCNRKRRRFTLAESRRVKRILDPQDKLDLRQFHIGMNVELEHKDITCGDPVWTGRIALKHMLEVKNYYPKLLTHVEGKK